MSAVITQVRARPCAKCPFRADVPNYLRARRRIEIATAIAQGGDFPCHETTVDCEDEDGMSDRIATSDSKLCAGAIKAALAAGAVPQNIRIMARLGMIDLDAIESTGAECLNLTAWASPSRGEGDGRDAEEPVDDEDDYSGPCVVSGPGCMAPAGYLIDGIAVPSDTVADNACGLCGEPVCSTCITVSGHCDACDGDEDDEDDEDDGD